MKVLVEQIDHLGIIAGTIKELKIVEMIDSRIPTDPKEEITAGEAVAGMVINGLGFSDRPTSLTPQFFENKALDLLFREGVKAEHFNRFKLGRSLDDVSKYGCSQLFHEIALEVCKQEKVDLKFAHNDTTSFSLDGAYDVDSDEHEIKITYGYSKDLRPDLKQAVLELIVTQDGGIPTFMQAWNGNESDSNIFKERASQLIKEYKASKEPPCIIGDSKMYCEENAVNLKHLPFITRMPGTLTLEGELIDQALRRKLSWTELDEKNRFKTFELCHYGMALRCVVVFSDEAHKRSQKTVAKWQEAEWEKIQKELFHLSAKRFDSKQEAEQMVLGIAKKWKYHTCDSFNIITHKKHSAKGRPAKGTPHDKEVFQIEATTVVNKDYLANLIAHKSCYVLIGHVDKKKFSESEIIKAYKKQNSTVEHSFGFLKHPSFFTSSFYLKKPSRIQGLLMIMTLALLVYSIAQRKVRKQLEVLNETLPNQINQPTQTPTLRWLFQILHGINQVIINIGNKINIIIEGITPIKRKILLLFGKHVTTIYQIS